MSNQFFLLDTTDLGFAAALAALQSIANSKYSFTPTIVQRAASHDANLVVVKLPVTDAELDADADLADLRTANFPTALCRTRWKDRASFRVRGFHVLGESIRSNEGIAGRPHYYVRHKSRQATGTGAGPGYGAGNGLTHYDAKDGLDTAAIGATFESGATYTLCGVHMRQRILVGTVPNAAESMAPFPVGDFSADPLIWRMDYEYDPGMFCGNLQDWDYDGVGGNRAWSQDGTNPNVWLRDLGGYASGDAMFFADPTKATQSLRVENWLVEVFSLAACRSTDWSYFADTGGDTIYINSAGEGSPRFRIGSDRANGGWSIRGAINNAVTRSKGFKFINCQFVNSLMTNADKLPEAEWLGGRYLVGSTWKPNLCGPGTKLGWSDDGEILFDTSDRPDPNTDEYIQIAINRHGSSAANWAKMPRFLEIDVGAEGFYEFGGGFTEKTGGVVQGLLCRHIGDYTDTARHLSFFHSDGHCWGAQGVSGWTRSFTYFTRENVDQVGNISEDYAITNSTDAQNAQNNTWSDFVFVGGAMLFWGDGGVYERTSGNGFYDGNKVQRGVFADFGLTGGESEFGSPPLPAGKAGFFTNYPDEVWLDEITFLRTGNCVEGQRNSDMCLGDGAVTNPASGALAGIGLKLTNIYYEDFESRIFYMREVNYHQALKTIVSITKANPCVVEVTGHGFPDVAQPTVYIEPEVYFDNMVGMTELQGNQYKAVWIDANHFSLKTLAGAAVDSTGFGTFTSGGVARAQVGYISASNNHIIKAGVDADTTLYRYANGNQSLNQMQALGSSAQQHLPGTASAVYESGTTID